MEFAGPARNKVQSISNKIHPHPASRPSPSGSFHSPGEGLDAFAMKITLSLLYRAQG